MTEPTEATGPTESGGPTATEWSSWSDWLDDAVTLSRHTSGVVGQIRSDWEALSREERPWTTDTIMNEVVNSWERFTPVLGELVQHWVVGASEVLRRTWPDAGADIADGAARLGATPIGEAVAPYAALSSDVAGRMVRGEFGSPDAVEAWADLGGMWAKSVWRAADEARNGPRPADRDAGEP